MKSGGVTRIEMTMYANSLVPDNEIWVSKKTYDQCAVERAAHKIKERRRNRPPTRKVTQ